MSISKSTMIHEVHPFDYLAPIAHAKSYAPNEFLFTEGQKALGFWLIRSGSVRLYSMGENLKEAEIHRCESGDMVAGAFAVAKIPFPHFGAAINACETFYYPTDLALPIITKTPELAALFLRILAGKCGDLVARVSALQMQTIRDRLIYYLGELCPKNQHCQFTLPMSKKELAQFLGTTPETLSRLFRDLQSEKILTVERRWITLHQCLRKNRCHLSVKT